MRDGKKGSMFKEDNGKLSFSRITGFILLMWSMCIITYLSIKNNRFIDLPTVIAGLAGGLYGINKIGEVIKNVANRK